MSRPLVSLCIPTYNRAASLAACLENIRQQDYEPLEILISDNGSTDETRAVGEAAARRDLRIRYVRQPSSIGLYGNHNFCLEASRGEFVCFFHDHDEHDPGIVGEYVALLRRHPEVGVVCSNWELINATGQRVGARDFRVPLVTEGLAFIDRTIRSGRCSICTPGAMIRRAALGGIRFDPKAPIGFGDFPVWFQLAERSAVGHLTRRLWRCRQLPGTQSARPIESWIHDYDENLTRYCDEHLRHWPQRKKLVTRWKRSIRRYVFWALAFEVGLHCRKQQAGGSEVPRPPQTTFEMLDYRLSPAAFQRALDALRRYRTAWLDYLAWPLIRTMVRLRVTWPLTWATYHAVAFRKLLRFQ